MEITRKTQKQTMHTHKNTPSMARRRFIKTSLGTISALGFPTIIPATALGKGGKAAPSERVTVGMIGCGGRGRLAYSYAQMPDVQVVALAARAGKHAYVEKPLGISIEQCLACNEIVKERPELQIQYGTQNRSGSYVRPAMELVLNGHIGEVKDVIACHLVDLAIRHGGSVRWDNKKQTIVANDAAQKAMHRPMRKPWDVLNPKYTGA